MSAGARAGDADPQQQQPCGELHPHAHLLSELVCCAQVRERVMLTPNSNNRVVNSTLMLTFSLPGELQKPRRWQVPCVTDLT